MWLFKSKLCRRCANLWCVSNEKLLSHHPLPNQAKLQITALIIIRLCTDLVLQLDPVAAFFAISISAPYCNFEDYIFLINIEDIIVWYNNCVCTRQLPVVSILRVSLSLTPTISFSSFLTTKYWKVYKVFIFRNFSLNKTDGFKDTRLKIFSQKRKAQKKQ